MAENLGLTLSYEIKQKNNDKAKQLISELGINILIYDSRSALLFACIYENWEIAKYCIENGADVNLRDADKNSPLIQACKAGDEETIKLLVEAGADVNAKNKYDWTPISALIYEFHDDLDLYKYLLDKGANPFIQEDYMKDDPRKTAHSGYEFAVEESGNPELIALLEKYKK